MTKTFNQNTKFENFDFNINLSNSRFLIDRLTNLYNMPDISAVRELISNAIDSTKQANSKNPIIVSYSSYTGQISVTDKGTGMSYDELINIYTHYGASTKNNNSNAIGEFGLGAKAALAYTDTFLITTVKDSVEINAVVTKTEDVPKLIITNINNNSSKENGTEIVFNYSEKSFTSLRDYYYPELSEIPLLFMKDGKEFNVKYSANFDDLYQKAKNPIIFNNKEFDYYYRKYGCKTDVMFVLGGYTYPYSLRGNIIKIEPNVLDFNSSREDIIENYKYDKFWEAIKNYQPILDNKEFIEDNCTDILLDIFKGFISEETLKYVDKKYLDFYSYFGKKYKDKTFKTIQKNGSVVKTESVPVSSILTDFSKFKSVVHSKDSKILKESNYLLYKRNFGKTLFIDKEIEIPKEVFTSMGMTYYTEEEVKDIIAEKKTYNDTFVVDVVKFKKYGSLDVETQILPLEEVKKLGNILIYQRPYSYCNDYNYYMNTYIQLKEPVLYVITFGSYGNNRSNWKKLKKLGDNVNIYAYQKTDYTDAFYNFVVTTSNNIKHLKRISYFSDSCNSYNKDNNKLIITEEDIKKVLVFTPSRRASIHPFSRVRDIVYDVISYLLEADVNLVNFHKASDTKYAYKELLEQIKVSSDNDFLEFKSALEDKYKETIKASDKEKENVIKETISHIKKLNLYEEA